MSILHEKKSIFKAQLKRKKGKKNNLRQAKQDYGRNQIEKSALALTKQWRLIAGEPPPLV